MRKEPRIIVFDIETIPDLAEAMRHFPSLSDYPGLTLKASINSVLCFGYAVYGEKTVDCISAWDYPGFGKSVNDDKELVKKAHEILVDADCVVTHNGTRFDWKFLQTRFLKHGLNPLHKIPHVDTCNLLKRNLFLFNNRLNTAGKFFGLGEKLENGGWDLWVRVLNRDKKAMELMAKYCKQDVKLLYQLFKKLKPFAKNIPNYNIYSDGSRPLCPSCGGTRMMKHGYKTTKTKFLERFICKDCGSTSERPSEKKVLR